MNEYMHFAALSAEAVIEQANELADKGGWRLVTVAHVAGDPLAYFTAFLGRVKTTERVERVGW